MVSKKGKRKIVYNGSVFLNLEYHLFDTEIASTKKEVERLLKIYYSHF